MNLALFYDTETQRLPLFKEPSEHPDQPHIVQLAACLVDLDTRNTISSIDLIVRPDGWEIPEETTAIHGITTAHALDVGLPEADVLSVFMNMWQGRTRIGHNESFDARIMRIAMMRHNFSTESCDTWKASASECTQIMSTPLVKAPPTAKMIAAKRFHHKSANLGEAYQHFMGKPLEHAHSAMADVQACIAVYFAVKDYLAEAAIPF